MNANTLDLSLVELEEIDAPLTNLEAAEIGFGAGVIIGLLIT